MSLYSTRIVTVAEPGGPDALMVQSHSLSAPDAKDVLIKVAASGVNRPDVFERMGFYPPPPGAPKGLGLEVSGEVCAIGADVAGLSVGDKVVALVSGGGYSDVARAHAGSVLPAPEGIDLTDAAGLPETVFTVWANVFDAAGLKPSDRFLVHGGASGIGSTAIQMAKAHGAYVMATAGGPDRAKLCVDLGADAAYDYHQQNWSEAIRADGGADVILDMVGGDYVQKNLACLNMHGRIAMIAFLKGSRVDVDLMGLMLKRQTLTGSTLRPRSNSEKAKIAQDVHTHVWPWIASGQFRPLIDSRFALDDVCKAHERMDKGGHAGKILLTP